MDTETVTLHIGQVLCSCMWMGEGRREEGGVDSMEGSGRERL